MRVFVQRSANVCAQSCYSEKNMRTITTSSRDKRRRSDSHNSRKQRPSSRIHCLRDECEREGVDKYSGACEPFNIYEETKLCVRT